MVFAAWNYTSNYHQTNYNLVQHTVVVGVVPGFSPEFSAQKGGFTKADIYDAQRQPASPERPTQDTGHPSGYNATMNVNFAFGKPGLTLELPEGFEYRVLEARSAVPLDSPAAAIARALDAPTGRPPLSEMARGRRTAAISVCDITRPAPNREVLPHLLARLEAAGIPREGITILIATGLHRPATEAEIREICGEDIAARYRVLNHHARELSEHRSLGNTASGTPVYIDDRFVSAEQLD